MRILLATMGEHGHVNPVLAVTRALVAQGIEVGVAVPEAFAPKVEAAGAICLTYTSIFAASRKPLAQAHDHIVDFPTRVVAEGRHTLPQLLHAVQQFKPDVVAYDKMLIAAGTAARHEHIPAAILSPTYAEGPAFSVAATRGLNLDPSPSFTQEAAAYAAAAGEAELRPEDIFQRFERLNLVFLLEKFQPMRDSFGDPYAFVGPTCEPVGLELNPAERRTVYISLGTVFNQWQWLFTAAAEAFAGSGCPVVIATGQAQNIGELSGFPPNIQFVQHAPQQELLARSQLFITHGGMNSVMEALSFGVPLLVIPQMPEQEVTAQRVVELGLGLSLQKSAVTVQTLRASFEILRGDPTIRANVKAMQLQTLHSGGAARAAQLLINFALGANPLPFRSNVVMNEQTQ